MIYGFLSVIFNIILSAVYVTIYSIYYVTYSVLVFLAGCVLPVLLVPFRYYAISFKWRRVFASTRLTFHKNNEAISNYINGFAEVKKNALPYPPLYMKYSLHLVSFFVLLVCSLVHIFLFLLAVPPLFLLLSTVKLTEGIYYRRNKVSTVCPSCLHKMKIPAYKCNHCHKVHSDIHPDFFHIFYKKCDCDNRLPVSLLNGRKKLQAICHQCSSPIEHKENRPVSIPVIGGPSVGKTCFVTSTLYEYMNSHSLHKGKVRFASQQGEKLYFRLINNLKNGIFPDKTIAAMPLDLNIIVKTAGINSENMISLYDFAGETYENSKKLSQFEVFNYFDGLIFIIDPFSISMVYEKYQKESGYHGVQASDISLNDTFDVMNLYLEKYFGIKPTEKIKKPCLFIINKLDAFDLEDQIGTSAIQRHAANHPNEGAHHRELAEHLLCTKFLEDHRESNFVMRVEHRFTNYRFFACSSISSLDNKITRNVSGTIRPFSWLLGKINKNLINKSIEKEQIQRSHAS